MDNINFSESLNGVHAPQNTLLMEKIVDFLMDTVNINQDICERNYKSKLLRLVSTGNAIGGGKVDMALTHRQVEGVISLFVTLFINCSNEGERKKMIVNFEDSKMDAR